jgi:hypothetical protein
MSTEQLLRDALAKVNARHELGSRALHAAVGDLDRAVRAVAGGSLRLELRALELKPTVSLYTLESACRSERANFIAAYSVPLDGFPILVCRIEENALMHPSAFKEVIDSEAALAEHFRTLATDPDSPLVLDLAFAVRQREEDEREARLPVG